MYNNLGYLSAPHVADESFSMLRCYAGDVETACESFSNLIIEKDKKLSSLTMERSLSSV